MATTLVSIPIYQINSNQVINRNLYPYGMPVLFAGTSIAVQSNSFQSLRDLQAGGTSSGALIYSAVTSSVYPNTVFWTNLTQTSIATLFN